MAVRFASRVSVPGDVLLTEVQGESVFLNLRDETYYGLDATGTTMWKALTTAPTIEDAYSNLLTEFDAQPEVLRSDLENLVEKLLQHGLVSLNQEA